MMLPRLCTFALLLISPCLVCAAAAEERMRGGGCGEVWSATAECFGAREAESERTINGWRLWRAMSTRARLNRARAIAEGLGIKPAVSFKSHTTTALALGQGSGALKFDLEDRGFKLSSEEQMTGRMVGNDTPYLTLGFSIRW